TIEYSTIGGAIVDYNFDGSNITGLDIVQHLKNKGVGRIHLCTASHGDPKIMKEATRLGVASVITKPIPDVLEIFRS
ncbi:MAG: hypothetical protein COV46_02035, partial [Deltaproteobacteria bacterium CG11_big_fil_rev_8_21_14_0_20_49_13]